MRAPWTLAAALGACALSSGCVVAGGAAMGYGMVTGQERTPGQAFDDAYASTALKTRLLAHDRAFQRVDVEVSQGRVLLTGSAPTMQHRLLAERAAWLAPGVEAVANEIMVGPRAGMVRNARDELISAQVRARLMAATNVRSVDFNVETHEGVVYLMGVARSDAEARLAAEAASRVGGVQRVISYVVARRAPTLEAAQLAEGRRPAEAGGAWGQTVAGGPTGDGPGVEGPGVEGADGAGAGSSRGAPLFPRD